MGRSGLEPAGGETDEGPPTAVRGRADETEPGLYERTLLSPKPGVTGVPVLAGGSDVDG